MVLQVTCGFRMIPLVSLVPRVAYILTLFLMLLRFPVVSQVPPVACGFLGSCGSTGYLW